MNNLPLQGHSTNRHSSPAFSSLNISGFSSRNSYDIAPTASRTNCSDKTGHRCIGKIYQDPENNYWIESPFEGKIILEGQPLEKKTKKRIFSGDNIYFSEGQKEIEALEDDIEELEFRDKVKEDWEEEVKCPICLHYIRNCVTLIPCAHIFCSSCLSIQLRKSLFSCPVCREEIKSFRKNTMVDKICKIVIEARPSLKRTREEEKEMDENDDITKGFRMITYQDGSVYRGFCKGNKREGQGILLKQNGEKYEGEWRNDKKEGKGEIMWTNGDIYSGGFVENRREGQGEYIWVNGARYKGDFVKNMIEGRGEYSWSNGMVYEGEFKAGDFEGEGEERFLDGGIFKGRYVKGKKEGRGIYQRNNGDICLGFWRQNRIERNGTIFYADGGMYEGEWKDYRRHGKGIMKYGDGREFEGYWRDDCVSGGEDLVDDERFEVVVNEGWNYEI